MAGTLMVLMVQTLPLSLDERPEYVALWLVAMVLPKLVSASYRVMTVFE
jgi:hypothetical protein